MGVLSGTRSRGFYLKLAGVCLALGLVLGGFGLFRQMVEGFPYVASKFFYRLFIYWGSIPQSVGYAAVLILISRHRLVRKWLEPAGRMAFSNYLGQSLLCTAIFYGHGFGLFGKVERFPLLLLVLAIWMLQLLVSRAWLRRFRFGPAEWLWRSLTYGKIQTLKRPGNDGALQGDMMRNMPVAVQQDPRFGPTRDMIAQFRALFDDEPEVMDALMVMIRVHLHQKDRPDGSPYVSHPYRWRFRWSAF